MELIIKNLWPTSYGTDVREFDFLEQNITSVDVTLHLHHIKHCPLHNGKVLWGWSISTIILLIWKTLFCQYFCKNSMDSHLFSHSPHYYLQYWVGQLVAAQIPIMPTNLPPNPSADWPTKPFYTFRLIFLDVSEEWWMALEGYGDA